MPQGLKDQDFAVRSVESKPYSRKPYAPFRTTTLQREASGKFGFSPARTMQVAQRLYEGGYITYMRTDSVTLSETAVRAARSQVTELYGGEYLPDAPRVYSGQSANAQEAHEAIRPAGESFRTPKEVGLDGDEAASLRADLEAHDRLADEGRQGQHGFDPHRRDGRRRGEDAEFGASGRTITFHGFLKAYVERVTRATPATTRRPSCRTSTRATPSPPRARVGRPRDQAAGPLHRGLADQGA